MSNQFAALRSPLLSGVPREALEDEESRETEENREIDSLKEISKNRRNRSPKEIKEDWESDTPKENRENRTLRETKEAEEARESGTTKEPQVGSSPKESGDNRTPKEGREISSSELASKPRHSRYGRGYRNQTDTYQKASYFLLIDQIENIRREAGLRGMEISEFVRFIVQYYYDRNPLTEKRMRQLIEERILEEMSG